MTDTPATTPTPAPASSKWEATIEPLVKRLKLDSKAVTEKLLAAKLVDAADDSGAEVLMDADAIDLADFRAAFPEAAKGSLNLAIKDIRAKAPKSEKKPETTPAANVVPAGVAAPPPVGMYVIPEVPEGTDFLTALSTSKSLTVDVVSIRAAMEALFADSRSLSEIPEKLAKAMEAHADTIEEPVGDTFLEVLKFVRARKWAEVNVDSNFVTQARKKNVLERLRELPAAVYQFHHVLSGWNEQLKSNRAGNPLGILAGGVNALYPPPDEVIAAAEGVVGCLRRAFGGLGVMVAKAMAYEGLKIKETLERPELPALVGASNREIMLKQLGVDLTNADIRAERNVARYVIYVATVVNKSLPGGQEGPALEALFQLGQTIVPWMTGQTASSYGGGGVGVGARKIKDNRRDPSEPFPIGRGTDVRSDRD
jgi:hypothetical protein